MENMTQKAINKILEVGNKVARGWGGVCYDFETFPRKKIVRFHCKEHGEDFITDVSYEDILRNYKCNIEIITYGMKARKLSNTKLATNDENNISKEMYATLMEVGEDVAMGWGAECIDLSVDFEKKEVTFECNEFGEPFVTTLSFSDIKEEYDVDVA